MIIPAARIISKSFHCCDNVYMTLIDLKAIIRQALIRLDKLTPPWERSPILDVGLRIAFACQS
ncbi:MAG: hypothetical protein J7L69_07650 [Desulfobulbaceae bacterium]|nr:hypothetical protein [Desulfobulbaceae bacterium]